MIQFFKKLFGGPGAEEAQDAGVGAPAARPGAVAASAQEASIEGFVLYVVQSLVDAPDSVRVTMAETERATVFTISCEKKDIGKIIGKNGRTIAAIRALANGAGGRIGKRVNVEVQD